MGDRASSVHPQTSYSSYQDTVAQTPCTHTFSLQISGKECWIQKVSPGSSLMAWPWARHPESVSSSKTERGQHLPWTSVLLASTIHSPRSGQNSIFRIWCPLLSSPRPPALWPWTINNFPLWCTDPTWSGSCCLLSCAPPLPYSITVLQLQRPFTHVSNKPSSLLLSQLPALLPARSHCWGVRGCPVSSL